MKRRALFRLSLTTIFCAGIALIIIAIPNQHPQQSSPTAPTRVVDESMTLVKAKRFTKGALSQTLMLKTWVHHKAESTVYFEMPILTTVMADGSEWQISANKGEGTQQPPHTQFEKLALKDNVVISSFQDKKPQWRLLTEFLCYLPSQNIAMTQHPVLINGPQITLEAIGMSANLNQHSIELLQRVSAQYAITSF